MPMNSKFSKAVVLSDMDLQHLTLISSQQEDSSLSLLSLALLMMRLSSSSSESEPPSDLRKSLRKRREQ